MQVTAALQSQPGPEVAANYTATNADVVRLASYAPLLSNESHVQWNPDAIWFDTKNDLAILRASGVEGVPALPLNVTLETVTWPRLTNNPPPAREGQRFPHVYGPVDIDAVVQRIVQRSIRCLGSIHHAHHAVQPPAPTAPGTLGSACFCSQSLRAGARSGGSLSSSTRISCSVSPIRWAKTMKAIRRRTGRL